MLLKKFHIEQKSILYLFLFLCQKSCPQRFPPQLDLDHKKRQVKSKKKYLDTMCKKIAKNVSKSYHIRDFP